MSFVKMSRKYIGFLVRYIPKFVYLLKSLIVLTMLIEAEGARLLENAFTFTRAVPIHG